MSAVAGDVGRNRAILGAFCTDEGRGHVAGPQVHSRQVVRCLNVLLHRSTKGVVRAMHKTPRIRSLETVDRNAIKTGQDAFCLKAGLVYTPAWIRVFVLLLSIDVVES